MYGFFGFYFVSEGTSLVQTISIRDGNGQKSQLRMHACMDPSGEYFVLAAPEPSQALYMLCLADAAVCIQRYRRDKARMSIYAYCS